MLFERMLGAAQLDTTSALLNLMMDTSVLLGTATLLCYKDFVQDAAADGGEAVEDVRAMYTFYTASCWRCGFAIALLVLAADWCLGDAVDRRRRLVQKLDHDGACAL